MGFRIQNNIAALNAHRNLGLADSATAKSLERLSSGFRINRAADDAAGLSVSQSFRADIASYKVAQRNVSEANAMLQVGEGALDQVGNMLTRMKELATQSASANSSSNLAKINAEYGKLMQEVDRIVNSTQYAGTKLLDGSLGAASPATQVGSLQYVGGIDVYGLINQSGMGDALSRYSFSGHFSGNNSAVTAYGNSNPTWENWVFDKVDASTVRITDISTGTLTETATVNGTDPLVFNALGITITNPGGMTSDDLDVASVSICQTGVSSLDVSGADGGTYTITDPNDDSITISNGTETQTVTGVNTGAHVLNFGNLGITLALGADFLAFGLLDQLSFTVAPGTSGTNFQVGSENSADNRISISLSSAKTTDIGAGSGSGAASLNATDLSTASCAQEAMQVLDKAIGDVSTLRGNIGADQNCLSYEAANLSTTVENITAADSVIRDTDMAGEMTSLTKNQILMQAGTAMLAQANTTPQQLLSLFRA